jgi:hypothetical protein
MKTFLVFSVILVTASALPSFAFARAYTESFIGVGTTQLTNSQYSAISPDNFATSSLDLAASISRYWAFSKVSWVGIGLTFAIPVSDYTPNGGLFSSPTSLSLDVLLRISVSPDLMITLKPSALAAIFQLYEVSDEYLGLGASISLGVSYYLTKIAGISGSVGYRLVQTEAYSFASPTYLSEGWFATVGLVFRFAQSL